MSVQTRPPSSIINRQPSRSIVIAGDRPPAVVAFESDVVNFFVSAAELLGVPRSLVAIYGIVFSSSVPLSFADIGARLDLSKGSVSQGLRTLREVGAVLEVSDKNDPAELFVPNLEMRHLVGRFLTSRLNPQLKNDRDRLNALDDRLSSLSTEWRRTLGPRLKKLRRWHSKSRAILQLTRTYLELTS